MRRGNVGGAAWLVIAVVCVCFTAIAWGIRKNSLTADTAQRAALEARRALCVQRANYGESIRATADFLIAHPQGIPGISRAVLIRSLHTERANYDALKDVECP